MNDAHARTIYFDPWVDRRYFYSYLPVLPLLFDRVFVYYPSDRWVTSANTSHSWGTAYSVEMLYWIQQGVICPVVQGDYPMANHVSDQREVVDRPTPEFRSRLIELANWSSRSADAANWWIRVPRGYTRRGREQAAELLTEKGKDAVVDSLTFSPTVDGIPELVRSYAPIEDQDEDRLIETMANYINDHNLRRDFRLGDYLIPARCGLQFAGMNMLIAIGKERQILHVQKQLSAVAGSLAASLPPNTAWLNRDAIHDWREAHFHKVLLGFLDDELAKLDADDKKLVESGEFVANRLDELRSTWPARLLRKRFGGPLARTVLGTIAGAAGFGVVSTNSSLNLISSLGVAGAVGLGASVLGELGDRMVLGILTKIRWDDVLGWLDERNLARSVASPLTHYSLSLGFARILGSTIPSRD